MKSAHELRILEAVLFGQQPALQRRQTLLVNLLLAGQLILLGFKYKCLLLFHEFDLAQQLELVRVGDGFGVNRGVSQSTAETDFVVTIYSEQVIV